MMSVFCCSCLEVRSSNECGKSLKNAIYRCVSFMHSLDSFSCCVKYICFTFKTAIFLRIRNRRTLWFATTKCLVSLVSLTLSRFVSARSRAIVSRPCHDTCYVSLQVVSASRRSAWWSTWRTTSSATRQSTSALRADHTDTCQDRKSVS